MMSKHKGSGYYLIRVAISVVLMLIGIPLGFVITVFSWEYKFPTPGLYIGACVPWLIPPIWNLPPATPALVVSTLVNSFCCYALIYALFVVVKRLFNSPW